MPRVGGGLYLDPTVISDSSVHLYSRKEQRRERQKSEVESRKEQNRERQLREGQNNEIQNGIETSVKQLVPNEDIKEQWQAKKRLLVMRKARQDRAALGSRV